MAQRSATLSRYPARRKKAGRHDSTPPNWIWMLAGLGMGLGIAVVVFLLRGAPEAPAPVTTQTVSVAEIQAVVQEAVVQTPPQPQTSEYSFYELLPQQHMTATEPARLSNTPASTPTQQAGPIVQPGNYVLQVGSYTRFADADRQRATLALQGIVSFIEEALVNQTLYYRVRVGPTRDLTELNRLRTQLSSMQIETISMRLGN